MALLVVFPAAAGDIRHIAAAFDLVEEVDLSEGASAASEVEQGFELLDMGNVELSRDPSWETEVPCLVLHEADSESVDTVAPENMASAAGNTVD